MKNSLKSSRNSFYLKGVFFKVAQKVNVYFGDFCEKMSPKSADMVTLVMHYTPLSLSHSSLYTFTFLQQRESVRARK